MNKITTTDANCVRIMKLFDTAIQKAEGENDWMDFVKQANQLVAIGHDEVLEIKMAESKASLSEDMRDAIQGSEFLFITKDAIWVENTMDYDSLLGKRGSSVFWWSLIGFCGLAAISFWVVV
ncbi:MAG: hypothetical protein ISN29_02475 [Gammaproteobacteria bacterium AqS3]|nr:hypothetical protein [Gammaproteobacteria bacterium AqS3]